MAKARVLALALAGVVGILVANSCSPFGGGGAFHCSIDDQNSCSGGAGGGTCEPNGYCSFPDPRCDDGEGGGRSYGSESGPLAGVCVGSEPPVDAKVFEDAPSVEIDATLPEAGEVCYGDPNGYVQPCFATAPSATVTLAAAINTDAGSADCSMMVSNTTDCVIAGATISLAAGTNVTVTGSRALVLVATQSIDIQGTLDASSRRAPERIGPSSNATGCAAPGEAVARGGGAGGTFGGKGGNGGAGTGGAANSADVGAVTSLRGGCNGGEGKNAAGGAGGTLGKGGGAVYLIANSITVGVAGTINASGAGGGAGQAGNAGGGGGGSGGFIGLDAPTIANTGAVFANGGGGGEGSGNNTAGNPGGETNTIAAAPGGTGGTQNGTAGGAGGGGATAAVDGEPSPASGAGGGGGGVGVIKVFRGTLNGNVSPPPS